MEVFVFMNSKVSAEGLAERIGRWEAIGVTGVLVPDHFFFARDGQRSVETVQPDPFVVLAAVGAMSTRLKVGTMVANTSLVHPAWIVRHLAELAFLYGGDRVIAGFGAGWNGEEFDALGMEMPSYRQRIERLGEALEVAVQCFQHGTATLAGGSVTVRDLPMSIGSGGPPRILVGGGSDALLECAARYADHVDLNGSSRRMKLGRVQVSSAEGVRRLTTTIDDLEASVGRLNQLLDATQREASSVKHSVLLDSVEFCDRADVVGRQEALKVRRGVGDVRVNECPYVLIGTSDDIVEALAEREGRLGLSAVLVFDGQHLEVLMSEVLPRLTATVDS